MKASNATCPLAALALAALLAACSSQPSAAPPPGQLPSGAAGAAALDPAVVNPALHQFARHLARAAADPALLGVIEREALQRATGDTEVLYKRLRNITVGHKTVESQLASDGLSTQSVSARAALTQFRELTQRIPRLHVALRGPVDRLQSHPALRVGVAEEGIQDDAPHTFTVYDAQGNASQLDAHAPLAEPLLVVGVNERTDDRGALLEGLMTPHESELVPTGASVLGPTANPCGRLRLVKETIYHLKMLYDHEPNTRGDAELKVTIKGTRADLFYDGTFLEANHDGRWYTFNRPTSHWAVGTSGMALIYQWIEVDGGTQVSFKVSFNVRGVNGEVNFTMNDGDDRMGHALVDAATERYRFTQHNTGDVVWQRSHCGSPL